MQRYAIAVLVAALGLALIGCAASSAHSPTGEASVGATTSDPERSARSPLVIGVGAAAVAGVDLLDGARFLSPTRLAIVTTGSGSCPEVPNSLVVQSPDAINIHLAMQKLPSAVCTDDLRSTPIVIGIDPKQINVHHRMTIRLYYSSTTPPIIRTAPPL
jgi:hypothetical protein